MTKSKTQTESLTITDDSKLTQKAEMFGDGQDGFFTQLYSIFADDNETGVTMLVSGNHGQDTITKIFSYDGCDFDNIAGAFIAAGHKWDREE